ncbi:hypothetical protein P3L10_025746 [Capsicum annuum]
MPKTSSPLRHYQPPPTGEISPIFPLLLWRRKCPSLAAFEPRPEKFKFMMDSQNSSQYDVSYHRLGCSGS